MATLPEEAISSRNGPDPSAFVMGHLRSRAQDTGAVATTLALETYVGTYVRLLSLSTDQREGSERKFAQADRRKSRGEGRQ